MLRLDGASGVTRTPDLLITNQLLYRLSYTSKSIFERAKKVVRSIKIRRLHTRAKVILAHFPRNVNTFFRSLSEYASPPE